MDDSNITALTLVCTVDYLAKHVAEDVAACQRAIATDPNYTQGYVELSSALVAADRPQEAVRTAETAMRLDPTRQAYYGYFIASPYSEMGRYREAIPLLKRHLAVYPNNIWAHVVLVFDYSEVGREQDARAEAAEVNRMNPDFAYAEFVRDPSLNRRFENDMHKAGLK